MLPLNSTELEQAIAGPAQRAGLALEPGLVTVIVRDGEGVEDTRRLMMAQCMSRSVV